MIFIEKVNKNKNILEKVFFKNLHNFSFPVTMYIYINTEYWPEHSVKTKSQKALGANFYVRRKYRGKTGRGPFAPHLE